MNILAEILAWSSGRPAWQRDALRRLLTRGPLSEADLEELLELCKAVHGLAPKRPFTPLAEEHIPAKDAGQSVVTLTAITHHASVNALAPEQTIEFGPALTIVYGGNAAGKSGYTRVLKRACRARGAEEILGNVLSGAAPGRPSATIRFKVGENEQSLAWNDQDVPAQHPLGNVSVFDSHCAAVYLSKETDVAFRPLGLDLFDKLSIACEDLRRALEKEQASLAAPVALPELPEGTAVHELLSHITSLTKPEDVRALGTLLDEDRLRLEQVRKQMKDLQSDDPKKTAQTLNLRAQRLDALHAHIVKLDGALRDATIRVLFEGRSILERARKAAKDGRDAAFPPGLLSSTGSERWRALWEAARKFSTEEAYSHEEFPFTGDAAKCVLCQQDLRGDAPVQLRRFEEFIQSAAQQAFDRAASQYRTAHGALDTLAVTDETIDRSLEELRIDAEELAESLAVNLRRAQQRRDDVLRALQEGRTVPDGLPSCEFDASPIMSHAQALRSRATQVLDSTDQEARARLTMELAELEAREALSKSVDAVLQEIERKKRLAAYQLCLRDTNTRGVTSKSSEVTKVAVTARLAKSFQAELEKLRFRHVEVELRETGGTRGALYHRLVLKRAAGVELPRVVSEGEARTLSIASFFAELSTASDRGAILFDDPVSSLDHNWRENVARRLAEEAKARQVVVFTHDIAFLVALVACAEEVQTPYRHQYLRRERIGAGVSSPELPWVAMKVKDRIGVLKSKWQAADKLHRTAQRDQYEREASLVYGLLREAWERGLEEVLLGGVVERYRRNIQTQQAKYLHDITQTDCTTLDAGMTKCSRWLPGHDQSGAENAPFPEPSELMQDIEALEGWIRVIRDRRRP